MEFSLNYNEYIFGILRLFINEASICKNIIKIKKEMEDYDILKYHIEQWRIIGLSHYIIHKSHIDKFSIIFNENDYIVKEDYDMTFFYNTGISYQIVELLHDLINNPNDIIYNDKLYALLAKEIMARLKY